jgi:hypothetical protein
MFLYLPHASLSLLSQQACAWSTFVGLQSFLTLCHHVTIISNPPPSQSHNPWPTVIALMSFMAPHRCCHRGHITPGPTPLRSHHSRPPAIVAVVVTSPPAQRCRPRAVHGPLPSLPTRSHHPRPTAIALTSVVNAPPLSSPSWSHHPRTNQRCCWLTLFRAPHCCCCRGHITPGPPLSRSCW